MATVDEHGIALLPTNETALCAENMRRALAEAKGNVKDAARILGITHKTLYNRLGKSEGYQSGRRRATARYAGIL